MTGSEQSGENEAAPPPLPNGYPDRDVIGWCRTEDLAFGELHIRMTITPGTYIVQMWEINDDGRPVGWIGNAFRLHSHAPCLRVSHNYLQFLPRIQDRNALCRRAADFWNS